jgi:hypothetical protein
MSDIESRLGNIEGKLDTALEFMKDREVTQDKRLDNHGTRIGVLENWKSRVLGIAVAGSFVFGLLMKVLL